MPLRRIFEGRLLKTTIAASLLATGIQGGYYAMFTWIPTYLKTERDLTVVGTSGYLFVVIAGCVPRLPDRRLRARPHRPQAGVRAVRARCAGASLVAYFAVPSGSNTTLLIVGFPLGFFASGCFSGFGSYLAELFPTRARGPPAGASVTTSAAASGRCSRASSASSATAIGLGGAVAFGVFGYVLAICALAVLPETHGREFAPPNDGALRRAARRARLRPRAAALRRARRRGRRTSRACCSRCTAATSAARRGAHERLRPARDDRALGHAHRRAVPPGGGPAPARRRGDRPRGADLDRFTQLGIDTVAPLDRAAACCSTWRARSASSGSGRARDHRRGAAGGRRGRGAAARATSCSCGSAAARSGRTGRRSCARAG